MKGAGLSGQIDGFLKNYGSPLAGLGPTFVAAGKKYGVDPRLVVGIAGAESSMGKHVLGDHNAWGWGPGMPFSSWEEGISTVTRGLAHGYISQGLTTPARIAPKYAPASAGNDPEHWSGLVGQFMKEMGASPAVATSYTVAKPSADLVVKPPPPPKPSSDAISAMLDQLSLNQGTGLRGALLQNLGNIASRGHSSPTSELSNLLGGALADRQTRDLIGELEGLRGSLGDEGAKTSAKTLETAPLSPDRESKATPGTTFNTSLGQPVPKSVLTSISGEHPTLGLAGYPARDYFAPSGSTAVAPIDGTVIRLSGHDPSEGPTQGPHGPFGWSVYIKGSDGRTYYLTHMGSRTVGVGDRVKLGEQIGTVGNYSQYGTPSHIHMGVGS